MPLRVFLTGGTGFIGSAVATAFRRAGHSVTALVRDRNSAGAIALIRSEVLVIEGDITKPDTFQEQLTSFDVLINAAQDSNASVGSSSILDAFFQAASNCECKKTVIYTSGCLIYGSSTPNLNHLFVEDDLTHCPPALQWRREHEQRVITNRLVNGVVVRPGFVYGGSGSYIGAFFSSPEIAGDGLNHWSLVHVQDLARAYVLIAEAADRVGGSIFNIADRTFPTLSLIVHTAAAAAGHSGEIEHIPTTKSIWHEFYAFSAKLDSSKIERQLNWSPQMPSFISDIATYHESWLASRS